MLVTEHYPLPKLEDIFASLSGNEYFTVFDLSGAYQQLKIHDESAKYLTINTHLGLFRYTRLTYGIASAPMIFQACMDEILKGIPKVMCYLDDILISGKDLEDCKNNVYKTIQRLNEYSVQVNLSKCTFFEKSVEYLGHKIDANGIYPTGEKVKAILEAPQPKNLKQLKSYVGMLNFYNKFIPMLSNKLRPLYRLQEKGVEFVWDKHCEKAFQLSKQLLIENNVLVHYDPEKPIIISCDASEYGLGAVLCHEIDKEGTSSFIRVMYVV